MRKDLFNDTVLITGVSGGIGLELAREFARHRHPLILVAPEAMELVALAQRFQREYGVQVLPIAEDLTQPGTAGKIFAQLKSDNLPVGILVNHAGAGPRRREDGPNLERDSEMIRLNIEAAVRLTTLFLPAMIEQRRGRILNTVPAASVDPEPVVAVYNATKAFVRLWSEALAQELEDTGVSVTTLCPGEDEMDFHAKLESLGGRSFQRLHAMAASDVARTAYTAVMKRDRVVSLVVTERAAASGRRVVADFVPAGKNG